MGERLWRSPNVQFVACCGAIDRRLKDLLVLGETRDLDTRAQRTAVRHAVDGVPGGCAEASGVEVLLRRYSVLSCEGPESRIGAERHNGRRTGDPPCVARLTPFELPAGARGGAQLVGHAASSSPRTPLDSN